MSKTTRGTHLSPKARPRAAAAREKCTEPGPVLVQGVTRTGDVSGEEPEPAEQGQEAEPKQEQQVLPQGAPTHPLTV